MRLLENLYPDTPRKFDLLGRKKLELCVQYIHIWTYGTVSLNIICEENVRLILD
jgi:hypothetical protein